MIAITAMSAIQTGEGSRIVVTYIATAEDTLAAIATLKADAMQHIDKEAQA